MFGEMSNIISEIEFWSDVDKKNWSVCLKELF